MFKKLDFVKAKISSKLIIFKKLDITKDNFFRSDFLICEAKTTFIYL